MNLQIREYYLGATLKNCIMKLRNNTKSQMRIQIDFSPTAQWGIGMLYKSSYERLESYSASSSIKSKLLSTDLVFTLVKTASALSNISHEAEK